MPGPRRRLQFDWLAKAADSPAMDARASRFEAMSEEDAAAASENPHEREQESVVLFEPIRGRLANQIPIHARDWTVDHFLILRVREKYPAPVGRAKGARLWDACRA